MSERVSSEAQGTRTSRRAQMWAAIVVAAMLVAALVIVIVASLAAAPETQPPAAEPITSGPRDQPTSTSPKPVATTLPVCNAANPAALERLAGTDNVQEVGRGARGAFGPAANDALSNSMQSRACQYPYISTQLTAELDDAVMARLLEATRAEPNAVESTRGSASVYTWADLSETDPASSQGWAYIFVGNIWIAMYVPSGEVDPALIGSAVDAVLAENPELSQ